MSRTTIEGKFILTDRFLCGSGSTWRYFFSKFRRSSILFRSEWKTKLLDLVFHRRKRIFKAVSFNSILKKESITSLRNCFGVPLFCLNKDNVLKLEVGTKNKHLQRDQINGGEEVGGREKKRRYAGGRLMNKGRKEKDSFKEAKASILLAADNHLISDQISGMLSPYYRVICVYDGRDAYETVTREHPDMVMADCIMPSMNGYDLLSLMKENIEWKEIPVILISSGKAEDIAKQELIKTADEFLTKPFSENELLTRVKTQLELVRSRQIIKDQEQRLTKKTIEQRDKFISIAGHELKTPLTSLQAYTELLAEKSSTLDKITLKKYLDKSKTFVERLSNLVTELLDVSRIKSGKIEYKFRDFKFNEMVTETVEMMNEFSSNHIFRIAGDLPEQIHGDRQRLAQVLQNLLSNAVKYSPNGGTITVYCKRGNKEVVVSVQDEGIGIPEEAKGKIFESYSRANTEYQISGLGLGLYICATIVERHGGSIWFESEVNKGSVFYFSLPL